MKENCISLIYLSRSLTAPYERLFIRLLSSQSLVRRFWIFLLGIINSNLRSNSSFSAYFFVCFFAFYCFPAILSGSFQQCPGEKPVCKERISYPRMWFPPFLCHFHSVSALCAAHFVPFSHISTGIVPQLSHSYLMKQEAELTCHTLAFLSGNRTPLSHFGTLIQETAHGIHCVIRVRFPDYGFILYKK